MRCTPRLNDKFLRVQLPHSGDMMSPIEIDNDATDDEEEGK